MSVFVTGATGFIGGHLALALAHQGEEVVCLVRASSDTSRLRRAGIELVEGDLLKPESFTDQILNCDTVYHVAGVTKAIETKGYHTGNVVTTLNLLNTLRLPGTNWQRFIYVSSQAAAGPSISPLFSENHPASPVSAYGKSKYDAEKLIQEMIQDDKYTILRPAIVYGPHDYEMLPLFRAARAGILPHPGLQDFPVNFIYIEDLTQALLRTAECLATTGKTYFLHSGQPSSWKIMTNHIKHIVNKKAVILPIARRVLQAACCVSGLQGRIAGKPGYLSGDKWLEIKQAGWLCSADSFQQDTGFSAQWTLETGVVKTAAWYKENKLL